MKNSFSVRKLAIGAVVAAMYTVLGYFGDIFGLTFGPVQFRFAEALTVLPFLFPETAWGLFVGCVLTNLLSQYGAVDIVFGSLATLLAGLLTARCRTKWLAPVPPVVCNGLITSAVIAYGTTGFTGAFPAVWGYNIVSMVLTESVICFVLGLALIEALERSGAARRLGGRVPRAA